METLPRPSLPWYTWPPDRETSAAVARHLDYLRQRGLSQATIYARRRLLVRLAETLLPVPLLAANAAALAAWRAGLAIEDDTVRQYVSHAHQFYAWAIDEKLISENPAARLPVPKRRRRLPRPISEPELFDVLEHAPPRIRPWLVLAGWCGLRAKEIALLRRECVLDSLPQPMILVATDATKGRTERLVPMSPFVARELVPYLRGRGWVFSRLDGAPGPNTPARLSKLANDYLHDCGVSATLHQLRHRFGTQAYQARHDLRAVQELMGHAKPDTTAGYAAYFDQSAVDTVNALPLPPVVLPTGSTASLSNRCIIDSVCI